MVLILVVLNSIAFCALWHDPEATPKDLIDAHHNASVLAKLADFVILPAVAAYIVLNKVLR